MLHCPVALASEDEIAELFPDCDAGAVPPIAEAYAVDAFVDESLDKQPDVYLEGGDHRSLIHISGEEFRCAHEGRAPRADRHAPLTARPSDERRLVEVAR